MKGVAALGAFVGSLVGGAIPSLWGGGAISVAGFALSVLGAIVGVVVAVRAIDM